MTSDRKIYYFIGLFVGLSFSLSTLSQDIDPNQIIDRVKSITDQILDYSADVEIEVDVEFINIPVKHATIYFKAPDKVKFKSDDFLMIPKQGLTNSFRNLLNADYSAIYTGEEDIHGKSHFVVKIIPLGKKPDVIMSTWWVDTTNYLISRIESNTRNDGTYTVNFTYSDPGIPLPSVMEISFEIEKMKLPLKFIGKSSGISTEDMEVEGTQTGNVYIRFSNYQLNRQIDNSFFDEEDDSMHNQ